MAEAPDRINAIDAMNLGIARKLTISLDGSVCRGVREYCISEGWVDVMDRDESGNLRHIGGEFIVKRLNGDVKVELAE